MAQVAGTLSLNSGAVTDQLFSSASGDVLTAAKMQHVYKALTAMGFAIAGTPTTREEVVFVASGSGTILFFKAGLVATGSVTSITFDLKKNGSSILTSVITVTNANSNRQIQDAAISNNAFVDEDVFSIAMTVSTSTGAQGPICFAEFRESGAPS